MDNRPAQAYLRSLQSRYARARKKDKGVMLDEFTKTSRCNRDHAIRVLHGSYAYATKPIRHPRAKYYTPEDAAALEHLSELARLDVFQIIESRNCAGAPGAAEGRHLGH